MGLVTLNFTSMTECISINKEDICFYEKIGNLYLQLVSLFIEIYV